MLSPENMHTSNSILTEWVIFRNIYAFLFMYTKLYAFDNNLFVFFYKKEAMNLKESRKGLAGGKGREKCYNYIIV